MTAPDNHPAAHQSVYIAGCGAVSPAGWTSKALTSFLDTSDHAEKASVVRPGWENPLRVHAVPAPDERPAFLRHPRMRRSSRVSQFALVAVLEALGEDADRVRSGELGLGIIYCTMSGCVNYSQRFYDETLKDPATASPLVFPETVFNAPGSHLAAYLEATRVDYTLVGDVGTFLQGLAVAADWLLNEQVEGCLVVGAEEKDWLTADAFRLFSHSLTASEGAGALYLKKGTAPGVVLESITDPELFFGRADRPEATGRVRRQLPEGTAHDLLCDSQHGVPRDDLGEVMAWKGWAGSRLSPKKQLGEGLMAASAWQCVTAVDWLRRQAGGRAVVSVTGLSQHAIGASFVCSGLADRTDLPDDTNP